ncbi:MAG: DnaJ domain-containing protein [Alphaproteobacteria bacterium]
MRLYNKAWNFYANMTPDQMERQRRQDTVWQRPTWPFSQANSATSGPQATASQRRPDGRMPLDAEERRAAALLALQVPYTKETLKACYRTLAKAAHPDLNPNNPNAEERFKELREAYMTLLRPFSR